MHLSLSYGQFKSTASSASSNWLILLIVNRRKRPGSITNVDQYWNTEFSVINGSHWLWSSVARHKMNDRCKRYQNLYPNRTLLSTHTLRSAHLTDRLLLLFCLLYLPFIRGIEKFICLGWFTFVDSLSNSLKNRDRNWQVSLYSLWSPSVGRLQLLISQPNIYIRPPCGRLWPLWDNEWVI